MVVNEPSDGLGYRNGLARHHGLVDIRVAPNHSAVDRHLLAGADLDDVIALNQLHRDPLLCQDGA